MGPKLTPYNERGFTLIELMIVIMIFAVFLLFVIPKLESGTRINLDKSARKIAGSIIFARNESIFKRKKLRIKYNIDDNTYSLNEIIKTRAGYMQKEYEEKELGASALEDGVSFVDITTAYGGKVTFSDTYTHFFTSGMVEKTLIHIMNENEDVKTLDVNVLTGEIDIYDNYYEPESEM